MLQVPRAVLLSLALAAPAGAVPRDGGQVPLPGPAVRAKAILEAALGDPNPALKTDAQAALGLSRLPEARATLEAALKSEDGKLRFGAARGLGLLGDPAAGPAIAAAFREEKGFSVKKELATAAGALRIRELAPDLELASYDSQREVAVAAAWALQDLGVPSARSALERLGSPERKGAFKEGMDRWSRKVLAKEKEGDARLAARTLAEHGAAKDGALLAQNLDSPDGLVRLWAAAGVLRLGAQKPQPAAGRDGGSARDGG